MSLRFLRYRVRKDSGGDRLARRRRGRVSRSPAAVSGPCAADSRTTRRHAGGSAGCAGRPFVSSRASASERAVEAALGSGRLFHRDQQQREPERAASARPHRAAAQRRRPEGLLLAPPQIRKRRPSARHGGENPWRACAASIKYPAPVRRLLRHFLKTDSVTRGQPDIGRHGHLLLESSGSRSHRE